MIEVIKEIGTILKDLPEMAVYILVGILFYKVVIVGSVFGLIKLAINAVKDMYLTPRPIEQKVVFEFDNVVYGHDGALNELKGILRRIKSFKGGYCLSISEVRFIKEAYEEKIEKEKIETSTDLFTYCKKYD